MTELTESTQPKFIPDNKCTGPKSYCSQIGLCVEGGILRNAVARQITKPCNANLSVVITAMSNVGCEDENTCQVMRIAQFIVEDKEL